MNANQLRADAANNKDKGFMSEFAKKQKILEVNPRSPLIEGLLRRLVQLQTEEDETDLEAENELKEIASILIDSALVRSGFSVPDSNKYVSSYNGWRPMLKVFCSGSSLALTGSSDVLWAFRKRHPQIPL